MSYHIICDNTSVKFYVIHVYKSVTLECYCYWGATCLMPLSLTTVRQAHTFLTVSHVSALKWGYLNNLQPTTVLCKVCKTTVSAKCGTNKHVLQVEAKTLAAGDLPPKCKQMIQPSIAGALTSYTSYGSKSKRWLEIHGCSVEKRIFKQRVKELNSEYMCPGGKCFSVLVCDSSVQTTEELQV